MNFLLRTAPVVTLNTQTVHEISNDMKSEPRPVTTLEGLIYEDTSIKSSSEDSERDNDDDGFSCKGDVISYVKNLENIWRYSDVAEDEGWIAILFKELSEDWSTAEGIESFHPLDRSFVFPGERLRILACLSASKQDMEVITPFRVAALMSKNGSLAQTNKQQIGCTGAAFHSSSTGLAMNSEHLDVSIESVKENGGIQHALKKVNTEDISATESLIRMEDQMHQTEVLLKRLRNSQFFVRIAEHDEPLWSKRNMQQKIDAGLMKNSSTDVFSNTIIDGGNFNGSVSGGMARNSIQCCSLRNGDIVVLLEVTVGTGPMRDPVLEILQFEKYSMDDLSSQKRYAVTIHEDPCGELLEWLLPLEYPVSLHSCPLSPPLVSGASVGNESQRAMLSSNSGSQIFSFGHFRSYSMSSVPQSSIPSGHDVPSDSKSSFDLKDFDYVAEEAIRKSQNLDTVGLLSFRGSPLEPARYSIKCGAGGLYIPGKRWTRKLEIVQPIEVQSFSAECNTEDLICVQIKNVSPEHRPDIVIYVDAITIIFEEAPRSRSLSLPLSCVETGGAHSLPIALRRSEEHSFILKPSTLVARDLRSGGGGGGCKGSLPLKLPLGTSAINKLVIPNVSEGRDTDDVNQYAVLVSFRCNFSESRLLFKKRTCWRPRLMRDLMVSIASEISESSSGCEGIWQLPVQALTLQATNLTNEDLTLTVLAPASVTAPPSVISVNSAPPTPVSPFVRFPELVERISEDKPGNATIVQRICSMPVVESQKENSNDGAPAVSLNERTFPVSDVIPNPELGCTHLWLKSTIPLGCVPAQSSAKVKLELLPLTDGVITLDSLQISVKEKGLTYVPEHQLKIHATSSIATGIM